MKRVHLIGLGGAGVSALAKYLSEEGHTVSGSDDIYSEIIKDLEENFNVRYVGSQHENNIDETIETVIYTPAVGPGNPEFDTAQSLGINMFTYPEYLGVISQNKKTIAVAGTNGKTTTTSMIAEILIDQEYDPHVIVGAINKKMNSNYRKGSSDLFIMEACEYKHSFLSLTPDVLVITNITPDHLDYFETVENYIDAFISLVGRMKEGSVLIYNSSDELTKTVITTALEKGIKLVDYTQYPLIDVAMHGSHNDLNGQAAVAAVDALDADVEEASQYLTDKLQGPARRMDFKGATQYGDIVVDDYAHNPEGVTLLIDALERAYPERRLLIYFQPHLFSRTRDFLQEFARALAVAHEVVLLPIYHAREQDFGDVSSGVLAETINLIDKDIQPYVASDFEDAIAYYASRDHDIQRVVVTVGAGDIYAVGDAILKTYGN